MNKKIAKSFHILSDFDGTLTMPIVRGKKVPSLISILRDNNFFSNKYRKKAHELYEKYHVYENKKIALAKKKKLMQMNTQRSALSASMKDYTIRA